MKNVFRLIMTTVVFAPLYISRIALALDECETGNPGGCGADRPMITNPLGSQSLLGLINVVIDGIITLMVPIIILMVIYSGFLFVTAQGNTDKLTRAKVTLGYTLLGALLILGAHALSTLIENTVKSLNA